MKFGTDHTPLHPPVVKNLLHRRPATPTNIEPFVVGDPNVEVHHCVAPNSPSKQLGSEGEGQSACCTSRAQGPHRDFHAPRARTAR